MIDPMEEIYKLRQAIDQIDSKLLKLLNDRSTLALKIGEIKKIHKIPVYDPEREKQILERLISENAGPLDKHAVIRLFERIIDEARSLERIKAKESTIKNSP